MVLEVPSTKNNVLSVSKEHFSGLFKFLSDEVESIFWESKAKRSKLFKSKFGAGKLLGKYFWTDVEPKKPMFWAFEKVTFQVFFKFLSEEVGNIFWKSQRKRPKLFKSKFGHKKLLKKWF